MSKELLAQVAVWTNMGPGRAPGRTEGGCQVEEMSYSLQGWDFSSCSQSLCFPICEMEPLGAVLEGLMQVLSLGKVRTRPGCGLQEGALEPESQLQSHPCLCKEVFPPRHNLPDEVPTG